MTLDAIFDLVNFGLLVLIWLVQTIIYPSFRHVEDSVFRDWHERYTGRISLFVVPLMFGQVGLAVGSVVTGGGLVDGWIAAMVAGCWAATFGLSVPCHGRLHREGKDAATIDRLIATNWIRTALWTAIFLLGIWF